ncbi:MAG: hypothetical protein MHPSP_003627, partial [Paramarteilia canceri]
FLYCVITLHANDSFQKEYIDYVEKNNTTTNNVAHKDVFGPNDLDITGIIEGYYTNDFNTTGIIEGYYPNDLNIKGRNINDYDDNDNISNNIWSKMSLISKIFLLLFATFINVVVVFFVTCCCFCMFCCNCCCGKCGKPPTTMKKLFNGKTY